MINDLGYQTATCGNGQLPVSGFPRHLRNSQALGLYKLELRDEWLA